MRLRLVSSLIMLVLLGACANPFAQQSPAPSPTPTVVQPTVEAAQPTAEAAKPTAATAQPTAEAAKPTAAAAQPTAEAAKPQYETATCQFEIPAGLDVSCGYLTVSEDRASPGGKSLRLHVAVFKSKSSSPAPDPVIYLDGGPGAHSLEGVPLAFESRFEPFLADRDFIMFDQRGTGYSEPALDCKELVDLGYQSLDENLSADQINQGNAEAVLKCHDRLVNEGANLAAYSSAANAADLNDLRIALGYDTWNLYGISYGTRLALTAMRDFPEGIRSVILDSTVPLQANLDVDVPTSVDRAFDLFFESCAVDAACNTAFPNLKRAFYELVDQLNQKPVVTTAADPISGKEYEVLLNGDKLILTLFQAFYATEIIPLLPKAIDSAHKGSDYGLFARLNLIFNASELARISYGMYYSVQCGEDIRFETRDQLIAADQAYPEQRNMFDGALAYDICQKWRARPADLIENQPVKSDIPALVLAGEYDPVTPPDYGKAAAQTLSKSFFFGPFPGIGHGVSVSHPCPLGIAMAFLDNPTAEPDARCIEEMKGPAFELPIEAIKLKPFESEQFGIKGVTPDGWKENTPGVYEYSGSIALLQQALPAPRDTILPLLASQFKLDTPPSSSSTREANDLTWSLYEFKLQGQPVDLALAEKGGKTYLVMLVSTAGERQLLYDQVFLPAIDAYTLTS